MKVFSIQFLVFSGPSVRNGDVGDVVGYETKCCAGGTEYGIRNTEYCL